MKGESDHGLSASDHDIEARHSILVEMLRREFEGTGAKLYRGTRYGHDYTLTNDKGFCYGSIAHRLGLVIPAELLSSAQQREMHFEDARVHVDSAFRRDPTTFIFTPKRNGEYRTEEWRSKINSVASLYEKKLRRAKNSDHRLLSSSYDVLTPSEHPKNLSPRFIYGPSPVVEF